MKSIILAIFAIMVVTSAVESQVWTTEINMHPSYNVNDFFSIAIGNGGNLFITGYEGNASVSHLISTKISPSGQILWLKEDAAPTRITSFFSLATLNGKDKFVERYNVGHIPLSPVLVSKRRYPKHRITSLPGYAGKLWG